MNYIALHHPSVLNCNLDFWFFHKSAGHMSVYENN